MISKIKRAVSLYRNSNKTRIYNTIKSIHIQYGLKGVFRAINNKISGRPIGFNLDKKAIDSIQPFMNEYYIDQAGNELLIGQQNEISSAEKQIMIDSFRLRPLISVVMPLYNPPIKWLEKAIQSIQSQDYRNWELCAVDDGSLNGRGRALVEDMMRSDTRIRLHKREKNGGISAASNDSLAMAKGEFIALIDQDDEIASDAFFWFVYEINKHPDSDFIYSDECKIDVEPSGKNRYFCFYLKPEWSPMLLINHMYTGHLTMYRTSLVRNIGGFRSEYDFSQDYDLALRMSDITKNIRHIERILYFWRAIPSSAASGAKDYARLSNLAALRDWYVRNNLDPIIENRLSCNYGSLKIIGTPKVSIIIPSDNLENMIHCTEGILLNSSYKNLEIILVTNSKDAEDVLKEFIYEDSVRVCRYDKIYNFSDKCNEGARLATGEIVIFYNDDVFPFTRDWIERQIELLYYPEVGGISPLLIYENQTIQYAGMITGTPGMIGTSFNGAHFSLSGPIPYKQSLVRDVSILSGACAVMRKDLFFEIGGFDAEHTPNGHSDLDLSLKLIEKGYRCVYTPRAILTHIGNHSWSSKQKADKADIYCLKRWGRFMERDPYFTDSMKRLLYTDFPYRFHIYSPNEIRLPEQEDAKDILFISHELSRTGAPLILKDVVKIVLEAGNFPVVISPIDGPLRQEYLDMGVTVIVDESFTKKHWMFERFARNFDLVFVNTIACTNAIELLSGSLPRVLWWIHEGSFALMNYKTMMPKKLGPNIHVYSVSNYTKGIIKANGFNYDQNLLISGICIPDITSKQYENEKMTFLISGSIEERKGQDILLDAIEMLKVEDTRNANFIFVGKTMDENIKEKILTASINNSNIKYYEAMPREEVYKLYQEADCIVVPSRDEPLSLVAVEAMAMSKPVICSDQTGISQYIINGENGIIFKSEDRKELADKICYAIKNSEKMHEMGIKGYEIYRATFTMGHFQERIIEVIEELTSNNNAI